MPTIYLACAILDNELTDYKCYITSTIEPRTLEILTALMELPELENFYHVGGTSLALYYGHRLSIDIDLFSTTDFEVDVIMEAVSKRFPSFTYNNANIRVGIFGFIDDVKIDLVKYHSYSLIEPPLIEGSIRIMSLPDIIAMKIAAILKRGVKKYFWDISELLYHYSVKDFINFFNRKYPNHQMLISIPQALTYFVDAEQSENPVSLKRQTWKTVKKHIQKKVSEYLR